MNDITYCGNINYNYESVSMGKTFKRNSYRKPKQHGRIFEKKKDKWVPNKEKPTQPDQPSEGWYEDPT